MIVTQNTQNQSSVFKTLKAPSYLNLSLSGEQLLSNNLCIHQLKRGNVLEVKQFLMNGEVVLRLCKNGIAVAKIPNLFANQMLRMRRKGVQYKFEIKEIEKLPFMPPHKLDLLVTQYERQSIKAI